VMVREGVWGVQAKTLRLLQIMKQTGRMVILPVAWTFYKLLFYKALPIPLVRGSIGTEVLVIDKSKSIREAERIPNGG
jgi:hypothetical protein